MSRKNIVLTVFLLLPFIGIAAIYWGVVYDGADARRTEMDKLPRIGAGANETGGANAIGEMLAGHPADHGSASAVEKDAVDASAPADETPTAVPPEQLSQGFVIVVEDQSRRANQTQPVYLASNHGGWNPGLRELAMTPRSDGRWQITLPKPANASRLEFKFTLGSWESVELSAAGEDNVPNRTLPEVDPAKYAGGTVPVFEYVVPAFKEGSVAVQADDTYRSIDASGEVRRIQVIGGGGGAETAIRDLLVWLPPGYDEPASKDVRYPVLYLMDGQNLFEKHSRVPAEWEADETAMRLIGEGAIRPLVIVGVPHGGSARVREYAPMTAIEGADAGGEAFERWMLAEVMPRVEKSLRVSTAREDTGIGGSSLGGAISLRIATRHPDRFGAVLIESLAPLRASAEAWQTEINAASLPEARVFIGIGGKEWGGEPNNAERNRSMVELSESLLAALKRNGSSDDQVQFVLEPDAVHNESAWAARLPGALKFLFPPRPESDSDGDN